MRKAVKWLARIVVVLVLAAAAVGLWKRDQITRLWAVNSLFDEDRIVQNFSHMDRAFLHVPVPRGTGPVSPLPQGPAMTLPTV
ncbi:MAG: serine hydrolase domain-containing protein, partial [Roseovarius sp.]